jgi:glycosyltransferase involved in cell wall biosynthesis
MSDASFIVVPSIWWENSPVVIEEAFHAGRPVICSDIGGMREKVTHNVNGLHFRARDAGSLSEIMLQCLEVTGLAENLASNVRKIPSLDESAAQYIEIYKEARRRRHRSGHAALPYPALP